MASGDLRRHTADVLRQASGGTHLIVMVDGVPVAEISPVLSTPKPFLSKGELVELILGNRADAALAGDLERLASETTGDLDPLSMSAVPL